MGRKKTNYSSGWEKRYTWIKNVKNYSSLAYVTKLFELMVVLYPNWHRMQVDSCIYNVKKLLFHWILQVFSQSPSLRLFFHQKSQLSKLKYCKHLRQLTPIFHLLQLMAMENYSEKCSQIQILLKDINKARRKLKILFSSD